MNKIQADVAVIGGGPGGMAAAVKAKQLGAQRVILLERDKTLGGILNQCIHDGFGLIWFQEQLSGCEYAGRFAELVAAEEIEVFCDTMVLSLTAEKEITAVSANQGILFFSCKSVILAMGCRERTRAQIGIMGSRPAGVMTAGAVQKYINMEGYLPGKRAVILGSGDIGLIMARRMVLEGVEVEGVYEVMRSPGGLSRNVVQCLEDYRIPLHLSCTVAKIHGRKRVEGVTVAAVNDKKEIIAGTERYVPCDLLVLSVGLIPENELSRQAGIQLDPVTKGPVVNQAMMTSVPGIFAAGNVVAVFDLVDYVSRTGETAAAGAVAYLSELMGRGGEPQPGLGGTEATLAEESLEPSGAERNAEPLAAEGRTQAIGAAICSSVTPGEHVSFVVPQQITTGSSGKTDLYLRVKQPMKNVRVTVNAGGKVLKEAKHPVANPPEMIHIEAPLAEACGQMLTVEVKGGA